MNLSRKAAIAGIGSTEFSRNSGRSEMRLCVEAIAAALADCGLQAADVDGLCTMTMDNNSEIEVFRNIGGKELKFFSRIGFGGGGPCAPILQAALAVAAGIAKVVICYRAMNERSEYRFGAGYRTDANGRSTQAALFGLHSWQGLRTPAAMIGIAMRRYMYEYGLDDGDFAPVSIAARRAAATNPAAWFFGKPITEEEYRASPMIADPFRLYDCCLESDGAVALVVTSVERAADLKRKAAVISAAAQGSVGGQVSTSDLYQDNIVDLHESRVVADQLYRMAGIGPSDIRTAIIYDHFGPTVLPQLEAFGFCARGEAREFIRDGMIELDGRLPVNPNGGQLGEAYIHGFNGMAEAVRQIRGSAANQLEGVGHILVSGGSHVPTSGLILSRD